jgi:hypothetical protein
MRRIRVDGMKSYVPEYWMTHKKYRLTPVWLVPCYMFIVSVPDEVDLEAPELYLGAFI